MHESSNENGIAKMREVESVPLVPGKPIAFAPGGYHLMLLGLHQPLASGASFPLTLTFARAPAITVDVHVRAPGAAAEMPGMGSGHDMSHMAH
jgi:periplasmic copper chaperone A